MEQSNRDQTGRRAVGAACRGLRRALGLDPVAPAPEHRFAVAHGTWQVCGINRPPTTGSSGLRRR
ncbi:MAG: hypothetical protein ACJ714_07680 [Ornithinibacter sp.]